MKGLLKNNFIGVIENLKLLFPLAIIFGIIVSITGNASLLSMYYFLEMSDTEIAKRQNISRSGVFQNRHNSLELMKKILKEKW